MNIATFPCPHCSSPLRVRDRAFVEREVGCPECGELIEVSLDSKQEPTARKAAEATADSSTRLPNRRRLNPHKSRKPKRKSKPAKSETPSREPLAASFRRLVPLRDGFSPATIAWMVAVCVGLCLMIFAWPASNELPPAEAEQAESPAEEFETNPLEEPLPDQDVANLPVEPPPGVVAQHLTRLGGLLADYEKREGHFPQGTILQGQQPLPERFGWLAEMLAQSSAAEPHWGHAWNDPLNDRFVRQQQESFLNPLIPQRVGEDRYPATHFVGVAGVGTDGPYLPVTHPRAGVFAYERTTQIDDIKDGTAETMMLAGVSQQLGSWAAGKSSLRAFTQEPYFNGPDGFGTGEDNGMSVLMADGSVRFLSDQTEPQIVKSLAAMSDAWHAEKNKTQPIIEPPAEKSRPPEQPLVVDILKPNPALITEPILPELTQPDALAQVETKPPVDLQATLAVKVLKFHQIKDVPLQELLYQLEELCGAPILPDDDLPDADADFWKQSVSLRLKDTTVKEILEALLDKVNLRYTIEKDHIQLHRAN